MAGFCQQLPLRGAEQGADNEAMKLNPSGARKSGFHRRSNYPLDPETGWEGPNGRGRDVRVVREPR